MNAVPGAEVDRILWGARENSNSWLEDLLMNLGERNHNPFDPTGQVNISIRGVDGGNKKK